MASLSRDCKLPHFPKCTLFPKFCISIVFNFSWDAVIPRRNEKQRLCKCERGADKVHYGRCARGVVNETPGDKTKKIIILDDVIRLSCPNAYLALQRGSFAPRKWPASKGLLIATHCNLSQHHEKYPAPYSRVFKWVHYVGSNMCSRSLV